MFGTGYTPGVGLGLSLNLPLFNRNQGEIARRAAEYRQVDAQIAKARRQIVLDVRQGLNNFGAAKKVFSTYRTRLKEMEDHVARSEKAFALGGITVLDWLDTQKTYRDFLVKYNQALVQANLTGGLLKIYTGEIK